MKRRVFLSSISLFALNGWAAPQRKIPAWRTGMPIGKFSPIPGSSPSRFNLEPAWNKRGANICWVSDVINAWNGLQTDEVRGVIYSALAGGHAATEQNGVYKIDLFEDKPRWSVVRESTRFNPRDPAIQGVPYFSDGRPTSRHTYQDGNVVDIGGEAVIIFVQGTAQTHISSGTNKVDTFRTGIGDWDLYGKTWPSFPGRVHYSLPVAKDPRTQAIWVVDGSSGFRIFRLDTRTRTWDLISGDMTGWPTGFWGGCIDTIRDRFVVSGTASYRPSEAPAFGVWNIGSRSYENKPLIGPDAQHYDKKIAYAGLAHDTINRQYLWIGSSSGKVLSIDPDTWSCRLLTTTSPAVNGVQNRFAFIPALHGCFYLPEWKSDILFLPLA